MILRHLFYESSIRSFSGLPIRDPVTGLISSAFIDRFLARAAARAGPLPVAGALPDYILLSSDYERMRARPFGPLPGFERIFRNERRTLYVRQGAAPAPR